VPDTPVALVLAVLAVLPGASFSWAFEREAGAYGVGLADRTLRFVAASVAFHAVLAWPEYVAWRVALADHRALDTGQFATLWAAAVTLVALPYAAGRLAGRTLRASAAGAGRLGAALRAVVGPERAPRAWDAVFGRREATYLRVLLADGSWIGGAFAAGSYAGGYPDGADLYLETAWRLDPVTKVLTEPLHHAVYVPAGQIVCLELVPPVAGSA
jgi:hypothetical protein